MKNNKGFSLIELIVVVAIMAIMGSFIFISFGLLSGQDARECASNLSTALDKEKNYALVRSGETDCYVEIVQTTDNYLARYSVPKKVTEKDSDMVQIEEESLGEQSVIISCYKDDDFEDSNVGTFKGMVTDTNILKIKYNRVNGEIKEIKLGSESDINVIQIEKGRTYVIKLYTATGKHTLERTD
ncbi:MAG: type II secretion system protein [Lachnospiraceae bacterium]|nr:type II secretion system protein [Lachnospiraceae bacterium]